MNKKDAARYLGISTRALEYHVQQGNIGSRKVRGKTGEVADFDEGEVRRLKARLDAQKSPRPAVVREGHESPETEPRSLARLSDAPPALLELLERIAAGMDAARQLPPAGEAAQVSVADKIVLSLPECQALTGLSRDHLRGAIEAGKLKGRIIGRGFKVKRADLDAYVRRL